MDESEAAAAMAALGRKPGDAEREAAALTGKEAYLVKTEASDWHTPLIAVEDVQSPACALATGRAPTRLMTKTQRCLLAERICVQPVNLRT